MTTATDYEAVVRDIVPDLEYSVEFVPQSKSRNAGGEPSLNWRVRFSRNGVSFETDYMQGIGHLPHYEHRFSKLACYDDAIRDAAESGKSRLRAGQKNGYDACQADFTWKNKTAIPAPGIADVLYCLLSDAEAIDHGSFEDWADAYGYDTDSRKAEGIYRACLETGLKLRAMLGDSLLSQLQEALRDM